MVHGTLLKTQIKTLTNLNTKKSYISSFSNPINSAHVSMPYFKVLVITVLFSFGLRLVWPVLAVCLSHGVRAAASKIIFTTRKNQSIFTFHCGD